MQIEGLGYFEWAVIVWCILVNNDAFNWHIGLNIRIDLVFNLAWTGPSWVTLGTSVYAKSIERRQRREANHVLILTDDLLCAAFDDGIHLNVVRHCHVVEDYSF